VDEGGSLIFTVVAQDLDGVIPILKMNKEIDNFDFVDDSAGHGTLTITPDYTQGRTSPYTLRFIAMDGDTLRYPDDSSYTIEYEFTINNVPIAPVLDPIGPQTVTEGEYLTFAVGGYHPGGLSFSVYAENLPENSSMVGFGVPQAFTFSPSYVQAGTYDVLFYASDGVLADSEVVTITVNEAGNQVPYFENAVDTFVITFGDSIVSHITAVDPDADALTIVLASPPANTVFVDSGNGAASMVFTPDDTQIWGMYLFRYVVTDPSAAADTLRNWVQVVPFLRGDSNNDGAVDIGDVSYLISYVFRSGPAPASEEAADCNSDDNVDVSDAIYLVNFIFRSGPPPQN
jgi:hypothetical protein